VNPFNRGCVANCREAFRPASVPMAPVFLSKEQQAAVAAAQDCHTSGCKSCHKH
jgi:hypothetical protein